jgi:hypothetical protein
LNVLNYDSEYNTISILQSEISTIQSDGELFDDPLKFDPFR